MSRFDEKHLSKAKGDRDRLLQEEEELRRLSGRYARQRGVVSSNSIPQQIQVREHDVRALGKGEEN